MRETQHIHVRSDIPGKKKEMFIVAVSGNGDNPNPYKPTSHEYVQESLMVHLMVKSMVTSPFLIVLSTCFFFESPILLVNPCWPHGFLGEKTRRIFVGTAGFFNDPGHPGQGSQNQKDFWQSQWKRMTISARGLC